MDHELQTTTADDTQALTHHDPLAALLSDWHAHLDALVGAGELATTSRATYRVGFAKFAAWLLETGRTTTAESLRDWKKYLLGVEDTKGKPKVAAKPASVNIWLSGVRAFYA